MSIVKVECEDVSKHPSCPHGPTLKFFRCTDGSKISAFYACSAYRDRKECPFYLKDGEELTLSKIAFVDELKKHILPKIDRNKLMKILDNVSSLPSRERRYCASCGILLSVNQSSIHSSHVGFYDKPVSDECLKFPSKLLVPLSSDQKEAQYWFSEETTSRIISLLGNGDSFLCIGAPRIHETCISRGIQSMLLDFDYRLLQFYDKSKVLWFNMFNFHFMDQEEKSLEYLMSFLCRKPILIVDPPFGARLEGLAMTLRKISSHFEEVNPGENLKIILVEPYFMEPKIKEMNLGLVMCNYVVEYDNHRFKRSSSGKQKSPVRLFANFNIVFREFGKICKECSKWVSEETEHCFQCERCPPGENFKHCFKCSNCVKSSWKHCPKCTFCVTATHDCTKPRKSGATLRRSKKRKRKK